MKNIRIILIILLLSCVVGIISCGSPGPTFEDTTWVLESYGEQDNPKAVLADTEVTATFSSAEGQVAGSAGCNSYFGSYKTEGGKLSFPGPIGSTMMSCGEQIDGQELQFLRALEAAESYKIENGKLMVNCGNQKLIFTHK